MQDQRRLIEDYIRGNRSAFRLVDRWTDALLQARFRSLQGDWDDIRQEVRIRLFRNLSEGSFDGRSSLKTYAHRIARNVGVDFSRLAQRRMEDRLEDTAVSETAADPSPWIARDLLTQIVSGLAEEDRRILRLVFEEHCSYAEVAARLGIAEGTVKSRMSRCRDRMLKRYRSLLARTGPPR